MQYLPEIKEQARQMYFAGQEVPEIAGQLQIGLRTLYMWIKKDGWSQVANRQNTLAIIELRIWQLTTREQKTVLEIFELERLIGQLERLKKLAAQLSKKNDTTQKISENDAKDRTDNPPKRRGRKPGKNDFTNFDADYIINYLKKDLFEYQLILWDERHQRNRNILKSRQIGLTFYFAKEAFCDALLTGRNKIFLSASRAQADVFREYIKYFAADGFETEIKGGDKIELHTQHGVATLYFLSTNSSTAQSYHGDVYIDEYFWIPSFSKLKKVATAMASQEQWHKTFFSTPSTTGHEAYPFWTGEEFNERNKMRNKPLADFPTPAKLKKQGILCPDNTWRWIITLSAAEAMGCNLFNQEQLKLEYSEEEFRQLFDCDFIDDAGSVFAYSQLQHCLGDASKFPPGLAERPVWIGYDPSRCRDGSCIVVVSCPAKYKGKMYVVEKITLRDVSWPEQAEFLRGLTAKYNVVGMTIDCTGPGSGVYEFVKLYYPRAKGLFYTAEDKKLLVLKTQQVIADQRIIWDAGYSDIAAGFMQIKRGISGDSQVKYYADRTQRSGHADAAWAVMHALSQEDFILPEVERTSTYE